MKTFLSWKIASTKFLAKKETFYEKIYSVIAVPVWKKSKEKAASSITTAQNMILSLFN